MDPKDQALLLLAIKHRSAGRLARYKIKNWHGRRGNRNIKIVCYICDRIITSYHGRCRFKIMPKQTCIAIEDHGMQHLKEHNLLVLL